MWRLISVVDSAAYALYKLNDRDADPKSLSRIVWVLSNLFRYADKFSEDCFRGRANYILQECVNSMKSRDHENCWRYDEELWDDAVELLYNCCRDNVIILSSKSDFKVVVPFVIEYIKNNPSNTRLANALIILEKAIYALGKERMKKCRGLLAALGSIADYGNNEAGKGAKDDALKLIIGIYQS